MATKFQKGETVRLDKTVPQGTIEKLRMDEDGNFFYLLRWTKEDGKTTSRWFAENELVAA
jgi:uncharacterized protein YodC (DUF2158 family)